eukprot:15461288-Alexandrium_andersonii.AAC.1
MSATARSGGKLTPPAWPRLEPRWARSGSDACTSLRTRARPLPFSQDYFRNGIGGTGLFACPAVSCGFLRSLGPA